MVHRLPFEERVYYVYILASKPYGTLYIGVTGDLITRVTQHKDGEIPGFTSRYKVYMLVYDKTSVKLMPPFKERRR